MLSQSETQRLLDDALERINRLVNKSVPDIEDAILDLVIRSFESSKDGSIVGLSKSIPAARQVAKAVIQILSTYEDKTIDYVAVSDQVQAGVKITKIQKAGLAALIARVRFSQRVLALSTADRVNTAILDHVMNGKSKTALIRFIRGILTGSRDKSGRPMSSHAEQIAVDGFMEYYSAAFKQAADAVGVKKFQYAGSLIKDSRPWCVDHLDKEYTREEIDAFDADSWAGKKPGSTFIVRGGYRCRHWWLAVTPN